MGPVDSDDKKKKNPTPKIVFESEYDRNPLLFLSKPWVQKTAFWVLLLGVLLYLRSFFALIFLTFLFSILMEAVVRRTPNLMPSRRGRVVMVFLLLLTSWAGLGYFMVPAVTVEFKNVIDQLPKIIQGVQKELDKLRTVDEEPEEKNTGAEAAGETEGANDRVVTAEVPEAETRNPEAPSGEKGSKKAGDEEEPVKKKKVSKWAPLVEVIRPIITEALSEKKIQEFLSTKGGELWGVVPQAVGHLLWGVTVFLLSLIFSFLIIWDWPRLVGAYHQLEEQTRAGPFFQVARETFSPFGAVFAQALGAQTVIALVNTALTAIGMALLGIPSIEVMSVLIFLCSFIPVAGVFISSAPICLIALGNNGIGSMMLFILVVTVVHIIEAYILNPRIYGAHLHMNPIVVLVLLVLANHLLGLWGLLLATPTAAYIFHYVLKKSDGEDEEEEEAEAAAPS